MEHGVTVWRPMSNATSEHVVVLSFLLRCPSFLATLRGIDLCEIIFPSSSCSCGIEDLNREKMAICTAYLDPITAGPGNWEQVCRTTSVSKYPKTRTRKFFNLPELLWSWHYFSHFESSGAKTRTWSKGTNSKAQPWIDRLHGTTSHTATAIR